MQLTTSSSFEGFRITEYKGLVRGITVRSPTTSQSIKGGVKAFVVGGNNAAYAEMCEQAREHAQQDMMNHAEELGANAVVGVRFDASEIGEISTEVLCYGTAVVIEQSEE